MLVDSFKLCRFFGLEQSAMNDLERDKIDTEAEAFMKMCKEAIHQLKLQCEYITRQFVKDAFNGECTNN